MHQELAALPLWAQVLAASRTVRRAALALPEAAAEKPQFLAALDAIEDSARLGAVAERPTLTAAQRLRDRGERETRALRQAIFWAIDACFCAEAALDFPVDAVVTRSAANAILTLAEEHPASALQIQIAAASDLDLLSFATREIRQGTYDAVPAHVFGRLTPVHPFAAAHAAK